MNESSPPTIGAILAYALELLEMGGYRTSRKVENYVGFSPERSLLAEDDYAVVGVVAYDTWGELAEGWSDAQGSLVEALSEKFARSDAKAWEGYLVLVTTAILGPEAIREAQAIERDTSRVRKLLASGDQLGSLVGVERLLLPLLPLETNVADMTLNQDVLEDLPTLLSSRGMDLGWVEGAIESFNRGEPILESLYKAMGSES